MEPARNHENTGQGRLDFEHWTVLLLKVSVCTLFLGRGYLYLSNFSPLTAFFWNQNWLEKPLLDLFQIEWEHYAATSEPMVRMVQNIMAGWFLVCALVCWWVRPTGRRWAAGVVLAGMVGLVPYWLLSWVDKDYQSAMFLEHFLQWGTPLLLVLHGRIHVWKWFLAAWLFFAFTFIGHGLYAIGLGVPHSNDFVNMCIRLFNTDEAGARAMLIVIGWLDILLPFLALVPASRLYALGYAAFWGLATAFTRVLCHFTPAEDFYGMHPWAAEWIVRFAHGLVPLAMLVVAKQLSFSRESDGSARRSNRIRIKR
jgi:hypothetical protein